MAYVFGKICLFAGDGLPAIDPLSPMREEVRRRPIFEEIFMFGPVLVYGFCATFI